MKELLDLRSMQGQTKGLYFIQTLLCILQKHNMEPSKLLDTVTDGVASVVSSEHNIEAHAWVTSPE
jgi:hypothetical protein